MKLTTPKLAVIGMMALLSACAHQGTAEPTMDVNAIVTTAVETFTASMSQTQAVPSLSATATKTASPTLTLTPTETSATEQIVASLQYYPLDTRIGIEELDGILKAVASGEPEQLRNLFGYMSTTCMTVNALGGPPPCRAGEVEGASVEVLPMLGAEGSFLRRDEAGNFPGLKAIGLYAVYASSVSAYSEENYPAGKYGIMLVGAGSELGFVLQVTDGQIVRIDYIFEISSFGDRLQRDASRFILAPKP